MSDLRPILPALLLLWAVLPGSPASGQEVALAQLGNDDFESGSRPISLPTLWRFSPRGDAGFAAAGFDDSTWPSVDARLRAADMPRDWAGRGWFRLRLRVDPELAGEPLALAMSQVGASEVYLDGELLFRSGEIGAAGSETVLAYRHRPHVFHFRRGGEQVLAVRYANPGAAAFHRVGKDGGFRISLAKAEAALAAHDRRTAQMSGYLGLFLGVFLSFLLLHLLLFAFYPETRENLYFALLCAAVAVLVFFLFYRHLAADPRFLWIAEPTMNVAGVLFGVFPLLFVYQVFYPQPPRQLRWLLPLAAALAVWGVLQPGASLRFIFLFMLASSLEMLRVVLVALVRRKPGAGLIGFGMSALAIGFGIGLLDYLGVLPPGGLTTQTLVPFSSVVVLLASMSVYLSREFARTHRRLRAKLLEVRELSQQKLEQERRARKEEVERKLLEAEYARKVEELEEARRLQLSMLPRQLPDLPDLEVAAYMETATEVGGDYYDFDLSGDGSLTVAIGDATGHGMRAGTMVTATKSLFNALASGELLDTLGRSTRALKRMNLRKLSMALTLARFQDGRLRLAAAGMPPAYIFRHASGEVETLLLAGMPLGSMPRFPYQESVVRLEPGDAVLLMSDGFPERLDGDEEMLGYDRAIEAFSEAARESPQRIVERLVAAGEEWAGGVPLEDDVTFVVLKVRP